MLSYVNLSFSLVYQSVNLSVWLPPPRLFVCPRVRSVVCLSVCLSTCLSVRPSKSVWPPNLSVWLCLFVIRSVIPSVDPTLNTKRCSLCNHPNDTGSHTLNGRTKLKSFYIWRHNRIVDLIYKKIETFRSRQSMSCLKEKNSNPINPFLSTTWTPVLQLMP